MDKDASTGIGERRAEDRRRAQDFAYQGEERRKGERRKTGAPPTP